MGGRGLETKTQTQNDKKEQIICPEKDITSLAWSESDEKSNYECYCLGVTPSPRTYEEGKHGRDWARSAGFAGDREGLCRT